MGHQLSSVPPQCDRPHRVVLVFISPGIHLHHIIPCMLCNDMCQCCLPQARRTTQQGHLQGERAWGGMEQPQCQEDSSAFSPGCRDAGRRSPWEGKIEQELPEVTAVPAGITRAYLCIYRTIEKGAQNPLKNYTPTRLPNIYFCFPVFFFFFFNNLSPNAAKL